jgi:ATP-dependent DNA helicase 2 subunit 2
LKKHCISEKTGKPLKFEKKLYVFTDAKTPLDDELLSVAAQQMDDQEIALILCGFDFTENGESETENALRGLMNRKREDLGLYCTGEDALELAEETTTKTVNPTTLYRGPLTLGSPDLHGENALSINVWIYSKTSELKLPTAKKVSLLSRDFADGGKIVTSVSKILKSEENDEEVEYLENDDPIKVYKFGMYN